MVSSKARAKLLKVDPTAALTMPGVVDFVSHVDVQGSNIWGIGKDETVFATTEVTSFCMNDLLIHWDVGGGELFKE